MILEVPRVSVSKRLRYASSECGDCGVMTRDIIWHRLVSKPNRRADGKAEGSLL